MPALDYKLLFFRLMPELLMVIGGLLILFCDQSFLLGKSPRLRSMVLSQLAALTCLAAILSLGAQQPFGDWLDGMYVLNPINRIVKQFVLILALFSLLASSADRFTTHIGEFYALFLFGTVGMLLMSGTEELLAAFIGLESSSLALYLMAGFKKDSIISAEAAMKYFLFGSASAAFSLFGISLIYGLAGTTHFAAISTALNTQPASPLLLLAISMVVLGFAFKIAAAPMHFWAPDTYQGAPIPAVALIASASKLAGFFLFSRFLVVALPGQAGSASWGHFISGWLPLLAILSLVSMLLGNLLAIAQSNFRRLIAYSAIAHAGYALLAIMAFNERGLAALIYYMFTYGLAVIGIFGVIGLLESRFGEFQIQDLDGLSRRSPLLAVCLMIFTLSLAGIPPLAGFFTKFYIFMAALQTPGLLWLIIVAIATSAISLYYYLLVLKHAWVTDPAEPSDPPPLPWTQMLLLTILALAVLIFGCFPALHVKPLESAAQIRFVAPSTPSVAK